MSSTLTVSYAALGSLSTAVTSAADDIEIEPRIEGGQGNAEIGSAVVADALSHATKQQVQRARIAAESVRAAGRFPLAVQQGFADADAARARASAAP